MKQITDAIMLREESPRSHVALTYGVAGLVAGLLLFGGGR